MHKTLRLVLIPLVVVAMTTLSGCAVGLADGSIENALESALEEATDGELDVDLDGAGGAELPKDWPSNVPVPAGDIITAASLGGLYSVTLTVAGIETAKAHAVTIANAGFTEKSSQSYETGALWIFTGGDLQVSYTYAASADEDTAVAQVTVQPLEE